MPIKSFNLDDDSVKKLEEIKRNYMVDDLAPEDINDSLIVRIAIRRMYIDIMFKEK